VIRLNEQFLGRPVIEPLLEKKLTGNFLNALLKEAKFFCDGCQREVRPKIVNQQFLCPICGKSGMKVTVAPPTDWEPGK
jgi:hypothetical protein